MNLLPRGRSGPIDNSPYLLGFSPHLSTLNGKPQEPDQVDMKLALLCFDKQAVLKYSLKDLTEMKSVLSRGAGEDQYVVQVNKDEPVQEVPENVIFEGLEHCQCIGEAEWHTLVLEVARGGIEHCLPLVPVYDPDKMVCILQVQLCKVSGPMQQFECRVDERQGVLIINSDVVEGPIVDR